jgi:hypothetical protein
MTGPGCLPCPGALAADSGDHAHCGLKALIGSPSYAHKAWVYEQYDSQVGADTVVTSGLPARAWCGCMGRGRRWPSPAT